MLSFFFWFLAFRFPVLSESVGSRWLDCRTSLRLGRAGYAPEGPGNLGVA